LCAPSCGVDEAGEAPSQSAGLGAYLAAGSLVDLIAPDIGKPYCHERVPLHPVDRTIVGEVRQVAETEPSDDLVADGVVPVAVASKPIHVRARCLNHLMPLHPQDGGAGPAEDAVVQAVNGRIEATENKRCVGQQLIERLVRFTAACVSRASAAKASLLPGRVGLAMSSMTSAGRTPAMSGSTDHRSMIAREWRRVQRVAAAVMSC
jgi:hypothetical protein